MFWNGDAMLRRCLARTEARFVNAVAILNILKSPNDWPMTAENVSCRSVWNISFHLSLRFYCAGCFEPIPKWTLKNFLY